ncbi:MAG TPA: alpha-galactosidase [Azospirillaceae bacterium]|nr:alpha-galactosidase [Azospirillaceae bacterium]
MTERPAFARLDGPATTLILDCRGPAPAVLHWGARLAEDTDPESLAGLLEREEAPGSPAVEAQLALTPLAGQGFPGRPGLLAHRAGRGWGTYALLESVERPAPGRLVLRSRDTANGIALTHHLHLTGDVLSAWTELVNEGSELLEVEWCAAPCLPLPPHAAQFLTFEGRWAGEFTTRRLERAPGGVVRENRRGRTSHDSFPGLIAMDAQCGEHRGEAWGAHLGWSGNHRIQADHLSDGRGYVQMGELPLPGELRLAPGAVYRSPDIHAAYSAEGLNGLSRAFHRHLRARPEHKRLRAKPRPVHYNSWEAVYFDHSPPVLMDLARLAADVGVERFVLDDGWFMGRRSDRAGLGDWEVDRTVWPDGLKPLAEHVRGLGMEFGLWLEPEMVNADSDLYRRHPDWVLGTPPAPQIPFRNQMVLDFGRAEVREHLFGRIDALLRELPIGYLKWDMNRDISQPGGADGSPGAHAHVRGLYDLLDRLRATHPTVEIESCASGGGRADYGILARTDRVWTSDSNDALDRLAIQKGFSLFFPPEIMGAHVGPEDCHITGRRVPLAVRAAVAMFGHMGLEMDLRRLSPDDLVELRAAIALHKRLRPLLHSGDIVRLEAEAGSEAFGVVAADRAEAVFLHATVTEPTGYFPGRLRLAGLDPRARYRLDLAWPAVPPRRPPLVERLQRGVEMGGDALMGVGVQLPRLPPQSALVLRLRRVG